MEADRPDVAGKIAVAVDGHARQLVQPPPEPGDQFRLVPADRIRSPSLDVLNAGDQSGKDRDEREPFQCGRPTLTFGWRSSVPSTEQMLVLFGDSPQRRPRRANRCTSPVRAPPLRFSTSASRRLAQCARYRFSSCCAAPSTGAIHFSRRFTQTSSCGVRSNGA